MIWKEGDFLPERTALPCEPNGRAWYEVDGVRVRFDCTLPGARGLCKLWLVRDGRRLLLGTPEPEGDGLALRRTVSRAMLTEQGVFPPQRVEAVGGVWERPAAGMTGAGQQSAAARSALSGTNWQRAEPSLTNDPILHGALSDQSGWSWRREEGGKLCLRRSWQVGMPFPIPPLFCLVRAERGWLMLWLDSRGMPVLPP